YGLVSLTTGLEHRRQPSLRPGDLEYVTERLERRECRAPSIGQLVLTERVDAHLPAQSKRFGAHPRVPRHAFGAHRPTPAFGLGHHAVCRFDQLVDPRDQLGPLCHGGAARGARELAEYEGTQTYACREPCPLELPHSLHDRVMCGDRRGHVAGIAVQIDLRATPEDGDHAVLVPPRAQARDEVERLAVPTTRRN